MEPEKERAVITQGKPRWSGAETCRCCDPASSLSWVKPASLFISFSTNPLCIWVIQEVLGANIILQKVLYSQLPLRSKSHQEPWRRHQLDVQQSASGGPQTAAADGSSPDRPPLSQAPALHILEARSAAGRSLLMCCGTLCCACEPMIQRDIFIYVSEKEQRYQKIRNESIATQCQVSLTLCLIFSGRKGRIMAKTGRKNIGSLTRWIPLTFSGKESWKRRQIKPHIQHVKICRVARLSILKVWSGHSASDAKQGLVFVACRRARRGIWNTIHNKKRRYWRPF